MIPRQIQRSGLRDFDIEHHFRHQAFVAGSQIEHVIARTEDGRPTLELRWLGGKPKVITFGAQQQILQARGYAIEHLRHIVRRQVKAGIAVDPAFYEIT